MARGGRKDPARPTVSESFCLRGLASDLGPLPLNPVIQNKGTRDEREALVQHFWTHFCFCPDLSYIPLGKEAQEAGAGRCARAWNYLMSMPLRKYGILVHEHITGATPRTLNLLGN